MTSYNLFILGINSKNVDKVYINQKAIACTIHNKTKYIFRIQKFIVSY